MKDERETFGQASAGTRFHTEQSFRTDYSILI